VRNDPNVGLHVALHLGNWGALLLAAGTFSDAVRPLNSAGPVVMAVGAILLLLGGGFALLQAVTHRMPRGASGREDS